MHNFTYIATDDTHLGCVNIIATASAAIKQCWTDAIQIVDRLDITMYLYVSAKRCVT